MLEQVTLELVHQGRHTGISPDVARAQAIGLMREFAHILPDIRTQLDTDVLAVIHHCIAHRLYRFGVPLIARIVAALAHSATGIDIHPGAHIARSFFIDHCTGVVISNRVRLCAAAVSPVAGRRASSPIWPA